MTDRDDDEALKRLYRDRSREEPPAALDREILDRARRETRQEARRETRPSGSGARSRPWLRAGRWSGLATAAVLVLALATLLRIDDPLPTLSPRDDTTALDGKRADASAAASDSAIVADSTDGRALSQAAETAAEAAPQRAAGRHGGPQPKGTALQGSTPVRAARELPATAAGSCPAARTLTTTSGDRYRLCSDRGGTTLRHHGCADPWPAPPDGDVTAGQFGVRLADGDGREATVYCRDGRWDLEPGPERQPPER